MPTPNGLLSLLIWLPIAGGVLVLALGEARAPVGRWVALATSIVAFVLSIPLFANFDGSTHLMQFVERLPWIRTLNSDYYLGVDGISMPLILLTTVMTVPVVIAGWTVIEERI